MLFQSYTPRPPLCEFVEDFRLYQDYRGRHHRETILPSGTFELVFNLRDDELRIYSRPDRFRRFAGALISGPYGGPFMTDTAEEASILGVHFRPGGAVALLGRMAGELTNAHIDLEAIWGTAAGELRDQLCTLSEPRARFRLLEEALIARLADSPRRHSAVRGGLDLLVRSHGRTRIRDVAKAMDLSQRRFITLFTTEVGLTPKLFARVQRFQRVTTLARQASGPDWAALAVECGYFDQSHLIRDFLAFSHMSPAAYRHRQSELDRTGIHVKRNHLPLGERASVFSNTEAVGAD
jgi:AraC-like DNA-binding protein